jgi:signal transduction histidine kinase
MTTSESNLILVVDDNETARYGKARVLRRVGFDVIEAPSGSGALRLAAERLPRLMVLDINLPDIGGWEVCRRVKANPETASIAVLQVSATHVHEEDTVRSLDSGADGSLVEPIEPSVLVATVRALLRARRAEDALRDALAREQVARASAEGANRMKDEFLATLSHELRSPLGAIVTWVTLLRSRPPDESRLARGLEAIERSTRLQVKLIEDLLDVSRIISGKMRLDVSLVSLASVIDAALDAVLPAATAKGIRIEATVDSTVGPISADAGRVQQVVWNLLSNAVKFTPKNGRVEVRVEEFGSMAQIRVDDTGHGIDPMFLPHIFERFRQADSSSTRAEGGLGLGLAIVRHLVELHGGTVQAESAGVGKGSTFTVRLPLPAVRTTIVAPVESSHGARLRLGVPALPSLERVRVLVLDDEQDAREAITAVLEGCGARVTAVGTVRDALGTLKTETTDVIVSDIAMPKEDGYTFIKELHGRRDAKDSRVPTLALTAYASVEEQRRILAAGFDGFLAKPIEATELASAVARLSRRPTPA